MQAGGVPHRGSLGEQREPKPQEHSRCKPGLKRPTSKWGREAWALGEHRGCSAENPRQTDRLTCCMMPRFWFMVAR